LNKPEFDRAKQLAEVLGDSRLLAEASDTSAADQNGLPYPETLSAAVNEERVPNADMSQAERVPDNQRFSGPHDVPEYGTTSGGRRGDADFRLNGQTVDMAPRPPGIANRKGVYALRVTGDSMEPKYEEGERVYVDSLRAPAIMDYVVIELRSPEDGENGDSFIKRLIKRTPNKYIAIQFNPPKELEFDREEVKLIHRVIPIDELLGA
jgi:phage repressor protein C with HTH and peptisase S24 domain